MNSSCSEKAYWRNCKKLSGFPFAFFKWLINCTFQYFCLNFAPSLLVCTVYNCFYENFLSIIPNVLSCHYLHCSHPFQGSSVMWYMIPTGLLICEKWHSQIHYNLKFSVFHLYPRIFKFVVEERHKRPKFWVVSLSLPPYPNHSLQGCHTVPSYPWTFMMIGLVPSAWRYHVGLRMLSCYLQ